MEDYLSPLPTHRNRRGSYEPQLIGDGVGNEPFDYLRRKSCPNPEHLHPESPAASPIDVLRKSVSVLRTTNLIFKTKPWNSDEIIRRDGNKLPRSHSGSSSSLCVSPLMSRTDLEQFEFFIPKSATMPKQMNAQHDAKQLGQLDVSQYLSNEEAQELKEIGVQVKLGEVKFCLSYNESTEKLKIILKSIDITLKPSPTVTGCNWACDPITNMELLPDKKKALEISFGSENTLELKKSEFAEKTLRLTIYDSRRKHVNLPVGHVLLSLRDVPNIEKMNIHSKKITFYSQPAGFNKGNLIISLSWLVSTQKLEIKIGKGTNLKSPYGVDGKDHYVKVMVYIAGTKHKSFKTQMMKATPDLNFREKFVLPMNSSQLKDSSIVFHVYMKHTSKKMIANKILTGRTIIGPYMKRRERSLSQWEKIITTPLEEITEEHTLYL